jgi:transposase
MSTPLISDRLWEIVAPFSPLERSKPKGGRPRTITDRAALTGIVFVLRSGIPWQMLPQELGCGCGMTCWRRLREWQRAGVWRRLHRALLQRLLGAGRIDWTRASLDSASVPAPGGACRLARIPRIVGSWARSVTLWGTVTGCR